MNKSELERIVEKKKVIDKTINDGIATINTIKTEGIRIYTWEDKRMISINEQLTQGQYNIIEDMVVSFINSNVNTCESYIKSRGW